MDDEFTFIRHKFDITLPPYCRICNEAVLEVKILYHKVHNYQLLIVNCQLLRVTIIFCCLYKKVCCLCKRCTDKNVYFCAIKTLYGMYTASHTIVKSIFAEKWELSLKF